jgi:hypothetical protein
MVSSCCHLTAGPAAPQVCVCQGLLADDMVVLHTLHILLAILLLFTQDSGCLLQCQQLFLMLLFEATQPLVLLQLVL